MTCDNSHWGLIAKPRKTPRQLRSRETVRTLLEAAAQLFEREGLDTTTNRIAERAGYSIGTLYQYFPNKQALLYALAEREIEVAHHHLEGVFAHLRERRPDWAATVWTVAEALVELHHHRPRPHVLLYEYAPRVPEGVARLRALHEMATTELAGHLHRCGRGGVDATRTAAMLVHAADAQLHRVLLRQGGGAGELARALLAMSEPPAGER